MSKRFQITPEFLAGAKIGRDNVQTVTIADLEAENKARQREPHLKIALKVWNDFKWELKKRDHTIAEIHDLINDAIIDVGTKVKNEEVRKEIIARFEAMKIELKKPTP